VGDGAVQVVLFDLGGVLVEVPGAPAMRELAGLPSDEATWRRWLECRWVARFERGECHPQEFAAGVVADWELPMSAATFLESFSGWVNRPLAGAAELVAQTAQGARVAVLSNLNQLHWDYMADWELLGLFEEVFLSFRLGLVKPEPEVFQRVAAELGTPPEAILFLDDNQLNVDAATACGFRARRVGGVAEAREVLADEGL
jgi:putative hydrolase of the HAD superfamily